MLKIRNWLGLVALLALLLAACSQATPAAPAPAAVEAPPESVAGPTASPPTEAPVQATPEPASEAPALAETDAPAMTGAARVFRIVPEQSEASYAVEEEFFNRAVRFVTAIGRTSTIEGQLRLDIAGNQLELGDNRIVVDLRTLTSDSGQRDRRIRSEWLQSNSYPWAEFQATDVRSFPADAAEGQDIHFELAGTMTIREVSQPVVFDTVARLDGDILTATAVTYLYMRDFGFEPPSILGMLTVTDGVTVTVDLTAHAAE